MATLTRPESRKLYSWWWDGHTAPKNSKWLLENLKDMDMLVKAMIKLLEEDADSFAKRAEMYYKRRPELLKLLEEFYRAYRAIAERYDHATGALRQAHRTLAEAFPHQMPFVLSDDPDESDAFLGKQGSKQLKEILESGEVTRAKFAEGRVRKDLNFQDDEENSPEYKTLKEEISQLSNERHNITSQMTSKSERADKSEAEVQSLKDTILKSCTEKEAADIQHQLSLEKIHILETEISRLKEDLKKLNDEMLMAAAKAKAGEERYLLLEKANESIQMELVSLNQKAQEQKEEVSKKQEELEKLNLLLHEQHQAFIQTEATRLSLEKLLSQSQEQESLLALEIQAGTKKLKDIELRRVAIEEELQKIKEDNISLNDQHHTSALNIINLQDEVQSCKGIISILNSEKKTAALQYQLSLERISALETEISSSKGDLKNLKDEMLMAAENLNSIQEQAHLLEKANESLQMELDGLKQKAHEQQEELSKKQAELDKLNVLLQDKHEGFVQSETARLSLEKLLSQSKEHERILELEILAGTEKLQEANLRRVAIEEELQKIKKENGSLNEQCLSAASKINILQDEISFFKNSSTKLENEVSLLTDEKKALQEELSCLKEDRNDLEQSYRRLTEQVEAANFNVRSLQALSKQLQSGNTELMERCNKHEKEKIVHLENIKDMGKVSERNVILENSLSDANVEIESLREKIKGLEQSCELLCDEISLHLTDKDTLASQVKAISQDMDELSEKNVFLENSLSGVNAELKDLREKLRVSEDFCQSLGAQKSDLLAENSILVSQVEETSQVLEGLEARFVELEDKHFNLETERDFSFQEVMELRDMLKREKEEYETLILSIMLSSNSQQSTLENQIYLMEDEHRLREEEFEIQQVQSMASDIEIVVLQSSLREMVEKNVSLSLESQNQIYLMQEEHQLREEESEMQKVQSMASDIEIVILQRSLREMDEKNLSLSLESQKLLEASKFADKLLSELKTELLIQNKNFTASEESNEKLVNGIQLILKELFISQDCGSFDGIEYEAALQCILHNIGSLRKSLSDAQDENQHLLLEKSVDVTILEQFGLNMMDMEIDKCTLEQESKTKSKELLFLQSNNLELQEMNKQLMQDMQSGNQKLVVLKSDMDILYGQLIYLREAHSASQGEICKLFEENQTLSKKLHALSEERDILEEENSTIYSEAMMLEKLYLIYKSAVAEKVLKLQLASDDLTRLHGVVNDLNEEIMPLTENIIAVEVENVCLKEMIANLYKCSPLMILNTTGGICEKVDLKTGSEKIHLAENGTELFQTNQKFLSTQDRNTDLSQLGVGGPVAVTGELQQKEAHVQKEHEISCRCQANEVLTMELQRLHTEVEDLRSRDGILAFKLQKEENEVKCCELETAALLENIQITTIDAILFEQTVSELLVKCESLEISFMVERERLHEEINIRNANVVELNENFGIMEGENRGMKEALNSYLLLVEDLSDDISSLEEGIFSLAERYVSNHQGKQGSALVFHHHRKSSQESGDYHSATGPAGILELQKLNAKVKALRKVVIGTGNLLKQEAFESVSARSSESALKEVRQLKAKGHLDQEKKINKRIMRQEKRREPGVDLELQQGDAGTSTLKHEQMMKDIELDLVISSSQNGNDVISCGESMIDIAESSDQSLDSWGTSEREPINIAHDIEYHPIDVVEEKRIEKELSIDKLELPKKFTELHEEWNGRVTKTLSSDAQRLSVLQTSTQELKRNMEASDMCNYPTTFEFDTIRAQLKEAEVSILQLIDINSKLTKKAEDQASPSTRQEPNEMQNKHRRQISELAARSSEKIGMLELELQKINYIFLKLGEEHDDKKPSAINRRRILLKDYLYGKMDSHRRRKGHCWCIRPKTRGD